MAAWKDAAACRGEDLELFFPDGHRGEFVVQIEKAKEICVACPVVEECLQDAYDVPHKYGIWGGTDEWERPVLRRRLQRRASAQRARAAQRAEEAS